MDISCKNPNCQNYGKVAPEARSSLYYKQGSQKAGCQTYQCLQCGGLIHIKHFVFVDGNKDPQKALLITRLLLSRNALSDVSLKSDTSIERIKKYILDINEVVAAFEKFAFSKAKKDISWQPKEPCPKLPITVEYDKDTLYIKELRFSPVEHKMCKGTSSKTPQLIENGITKKLAIFDQNFRVQKIGFQNDVLNIYRVHHNFSEKDRQDRTPAMRAGLADQAISLPQLMSIII